MHHISVYRLLSLEKSHISNCSTTCRLLLWSLIHFWCVDVLVFCLLLLIGFVDPLTFSLSLVLLFILCFYVWSGEKLFRCCFMLILRTWSRTKNFNFNLFLNKKAEKPKMIIDECWISKRNDKLFNENARKRAIEISPKLTFSFHSF